MLGVGGRREGGGGGNLNCGGGGPPLLSLCEALYTESNIILQSQYTLKD